MHICFGYSMDLKAERRVPGRKISVFKRLGEGRRFNSIVCKDWLAGRCCRNPCRFLHRELPPPQPKQSHDHSSHYYGPKWNRRNPNCCSFKNTPVSMNGGALLAGKIAQEAQHGVSNKEGVGSGDKSVQKTQLKCAPVSKNDGAIAMCKIAQESQHVVLNSDDAGSGAKSIQKAQLKLCKFWVTGNCVQGANCKGLHSWFCGYGFSMLAKLEGHSKAVTGIALPSGSNKLYSCSKDKSVRVWDCSTGQCAGVVNLDLEVGNLISEGPLVFLGLPNAVKAWDINTHAELTLNELSGPVYAMVVGHNMLFVGTEDGTILAWKSGSETSSPELTASLKGHTRAVLSLIVRAERLYSGSMDFTVRVWDLENLQCMETLNGHTNAVTSVLCWDSFLLSGSLDSTVKVWAPTETGNLEMVYEHNEKHGVVELCGIHDAKAKPVLLCSCKDNTVRLYEMPSFNERGRIFTKYEVRVIQVGTDGLFFTGDAKGELFVWKLHRDGCATVS